MRTPFSPIAEARLEIKQCHIVSCAKADPAYGAGLAKCAGPGAVERHCGIARGGC